MPFDTLSLFPAHWGSPQPIHPWANDNHPAPGLGSRLDTLPNELLTDITRRLDKRATLALAETSKRFDGLLQDTLQCIRLERDIGNVVTSREFANITGRILNVRPAERLRLTRQLGKQRHQLHPSLLPDLQPALDKLAPPGSREQLVLQLDWESWRHRLPAGLRRGAPTQLPPLARILHPPSGPDLLIQWLGIAGDAGVRQLSVDQWRWLARRLPDGGAAALLHALLTAVSAADRVLWFALLDDAVALTERLLRPNSAGVLQLYALKLLSTVSTTLGADDEGADDCLTPRRQRWEHLLNLLSGLPDSLRRVLVKPMAQYPCYELACHDTAAQQPGTVPAWQRMVNALVPPSNDTENVADVVCTLLDALHGRPVRWNRPAIWDRNEFFSALMQRTAAFTGRDRARVLQGTIRLLADHRLSDEERYQYWRAGLQATDGLPLEFQALPLQALALLIEAEFETYVAEHHNAGGAREPVLWNMLFERVIRFPAEARLAPALALAAVGSQIDDSVQCTEKLVRLAATLPSADRAAFLSKLMEDHDYVYGDPGLWTNIVTLIVNLPAEVKTPALRSVILTLATRHGLMEDVSGNAGGVPLGPGDSELSTWPESAAHARALASRALSSLPTSVVGPLLEEIAASDDDIDTLRWTLRQIRQFSTRNVAYKAALVTRACAAVAKRGHLPIDVLDDVWPMVTSIPIRLQASALQYVRDFIVLRASPEPWIQVVTSAIEALRHEELPPAGARKRKLDATGAT